jgi:hypothetical protein
MPDWTPTELDLLRAVHTDIGHCIANPASAIEGFRDGHRSGGGGGFQFEFTKTALVGQWHEWMPIKWAAADDRRPTGQPIRWRAGALLREATVSYRRLERWCAEMPAGIREQALIHWRTYLVDSRDLPALTSLTLAAINGEFGAEPALFDLAEVSAP